MKNQPFAVENCDVGKKERKRKVERGKCLGKVEIKIEVKDKVEVENGECLVEVEVGD